MIDQEHEEGLNRLANEAGKVVIANGSVKFREATPIGLASACSSPHSG